MPFILSPTAASLCTETSSPKHTMSPFGDLFKRKSIRDPSKPSRSPSLLSRKVSGKTVQAERSPLSLLDQQSSPAPPTRRPQNPAGISNPFASHSNAPPPSYSEAPPDYAPPSPAVAPGTDDPYHFLTNFDTIFLIDDSGSMAGRSWRETSAAIAAIAPICTAHDKDGIDIHFLNAPDSPSYKNITSATAVSRIFDTVRPGGGTPTGTRLAKILRPHVEACQAVGSAAIEDKIKPLNVIVITDGVPSDDPESVIISIAKKLDKLDAPAHQIGIQFFQVGNEQGAAEALEELDDEVKERGNCRDMVDTVPWKGKNSEGLNAEGILKVVLGSVNKRLDRKRVSLDGRPGLGARSRR